MSINTLKGTDVEYVPIQSIQPNAYNPNVQSEHEFGLLCQSMRRDGFTQPIIVQRDGRTIVDGEHRWRAAQAVGYSEVPVVFVDMTPEQMRISTLRHNRARGQEDMQLAVEVMRDLADLGVDLHDLSGELQVDVNTLALELDMEVPLLNTESLVDGLDTAQEDSVPPEIADLLRKKEGAAAAQWKAEEKSAKVADTSYYFVSLTYDETEGEVVTRALATFDATSHANAISALCRKAVEQGW